MNLTRLLIMSSLLISLPGFAASSITTASILASAASMSCAAYRPVGVCFWLRCGFSGCRVVTSLKVGHYNPDLVISAQNGIKNNPWIEMNAVTGNASQSALAALISGVVNVEAGGNISQSKSVTRNKALKYKASDAIGHPGSILPIPYKCPSQAQPFYPYFISGLDAIGWNLAIPEMIYPQALIPGLREIGQFPLYSWGSVYPRSGFLLQTSDAKTGAVIAQRVGDIVTRELSAHVYTPISALSTPSLGMKVWTPGELIETDEDTGKWQMLVPNLETSCMVFGTNDLTSLTGWDSGNTADEANYSWTLWRPYSCCRDRGRFLGSIGDYP